MDLNLFWDSAVEVAVVFQRDCYLNFFYGILVLQTKPI